MTNAIEPEIVETPGTTPMSTDTLPIESNEVDDYCPPLPSTALANQNPTPPQILALALQRGDDIGKLEKLLELQERWEKTQARKAYVAAMSAFKAEPIEILKGRLVEYETKNSGTVRFAHATLAAVVDGVCQTMSRYGLSHSWEVIQAAGAITVSCIVTHADGHSEKVTMSAPPDDSGQKNKIQQIASTVTYLERYTLMAACGLAAKDQDLDSLTRERHDAPEPDPSAPKTATRGERKETSAKPVTSGEVMHLYNEWRDTFGQNVEQVKRAEEFTKFVFMATGANFDTQKSREWQRGYVALVKAKLALPPDEIPPGNAQSDWRNENDESQIPF